MFTWLRDLFTRKRSDDDAKVLRVKQSIIRQVKEGESVTFSEIVARLKRDGVVATNTEVESAVRLIVKEKRGVVRPGSDHPHFAKAAHPPKAAAKSGSAS
jgi:hypothetical protein